MFVTGYITKKIDEDHFVVSQVIGYNYVVNKKILQVKTKNGKIDRSTSNTGKPLVRFEVFGDYNEDYHRMYIWTPNCGHEKMIEFNGNSYWY